MFDSGFGWGGLPGKALAVAKAAWRCFLGSASVRTTPALALVVALLAAGSAGAALRIEVVKPPKFVNIDLGPWPELLERESAARWSRIDAAAAKLAHEVNADPSRLIVLRVDGLPLSFTRLAAADQWRLSQLVEGQGEAPHAAYEHAVSEMLQEILARAAGPNSGALFAVAGLPLDSATDEETNARYANALAACSAIVTARSIILTGAGQNEPAIVRRAMEQMLKAAEARPMFYSCNGEWRRAVVDDAPGAIDTYPPTPEWQVRAGSAHTPVTNQNAKGSARQFAHSGSTIAAPPADLPVYAHDGIGGGGYFRGGTRSSDGKARAPIALRGGQADQRAANAGGRAKDATGAAKTPSASNVKPAVAQKPSPAGSGSGSGSGSGATAEACPTVPLILVGERPSAKVKSMYPQWGAKDIPMIYDGDVDPNHTGFFTNVAGLIAGLNRETAPDYSGPFCIDWEGQAIENLQIGVSAATLQTQIAEYVKLIKKAQQLRPKAQFGFYGLPRSSLYPMSAAEEVHALKLKPIYDASNCFFPCVYRYYPGDFPNYPHQENLAYIKRTVEQSLVVANGRPVYPYYCHRYHSWYEVVSCRLIPLDHFRDDVTAIFAAKHDGRRARGVAWWGADQWGWWVATHPTEYPDGPLLAQIFAEEMLPGETSDEFFDRTHTERLVLLDEIVRSTPGTATGVVAQCDGAVP